VTAQAAASAPQPRAARPARNRQASAADAAPGFSIQ
jgi:hypothetical protein